MYVGIVYLLFVLSSILMVAKAGVQIIDILLLNRLCSTLYIQKVYSIYIA